MKCDNCGMTIKPDDMIFASSNHGVRRTVHMICPTTNAEILALMKELDINHCGLSITICQDGPSGPDVLDKQLMIAVDYKGGGATFLPVQEFTWGSKINKVKRLEELLWGTFS